MTKRATELWAKFFDES